MRCTTRICSTVLVAPSVPGVKALSAVFLSDTGLLRRNCPSLMISSFVSASVIRARSACVAKPQNTTLCIVPTPKSRYRHSS